MFRCNDINCGRHCCFWFYVCFVLQKVVRLSQGDESSGKGSGLFFADPSLNTSTCR